MSDLWNENGKNILDMQDIHIIL